MIFVEYFALLVVKTLVGMMYVLPMPLAMWVARFCIFFLRLFMWRSRAVSMRNLELVFPTSSYSQRKKWTQECFETLAGNLVRYSKIPTLAKRDLAELTDVEKTRIELQKLRAAHPDCGILFPTAHMAYFEMCVQICILIDRPIAILARGFGLPRVDRWWNQRREMFGCQMFERAGGFKETIERLNNGQDVCMLFDQNVKKNHAVFVDFFGIKAATTKTVALAAVRTGAPVCFITSYANEKSDFNIFLKVLPRPESFGSNVDEQICGITRALHEALEEVIKLAPGQWFWLHRRFKTRPEGEPENLYQGC